MTAGDTGVPTPPLTPRLPARDPSEWLNALSHFAREGGEVTRLRGAWLFKHPDAVRDVLVTRDRSFVKSPALRRARFTLGNGLLTNEGETYRRQRALVQPSLHPKSLAGYAGIMARRAAETAGRWQNGRTVDVHREMTRLTLAIVAEALFGTPVGPEVDEISRAMDYNVAMFRRLTSPWGRLKVLLPTPFTFRFLLARRRLVGTLRRFIARRRAAGFDRDDLLSRLLKARDAGYGRGMSESQLVDECVTLFAAGHETTANALAFTLWLLARHPKVMRRLQGEVDVALGDERLPTVEDVDALPYTRAVVAESMRLYPPAWILGRQATEDVAVFDRTVRRGEVVFVSQWVTHRDPRWWPTRSASTPTGSRLSARWAGQGGRTSRSGAARACVWARRSPGRRR